MDTITSVTARIDFENNAEEFWDAFRDAIQALGRNSELFVNCQYLLKNDEVELADATAIEEFDAFVSSLPGWENGPAHAPTAITFTPNH